MNDQAIQNEFKFAGDILASNVESLKGEIKKFIAANNVANIVFNLTETNVIDSAGIGLLIATYNSLNQNGGTVTVINASDNIKQLFVMLRIDKYLHI